MRDPQPGSRLRTARTAGRILAVAMLLHAAGASAAPSGQTRNPGRKAETPASLALDELLARAARYCRRLESSAFDFVCREEIRETIDPGLDMAARRPVNAPSSSGDTYDMDKSSGGFTPSQCEEDSALGVVDFADDSVSFIRAFSASLFCDNRVQVIFYEWQTRQV